MSLPHTAKQVILQNYAPQGIELSGGSASTFTVKEVPLPPVADDSLLVKILYLSNDPGQKLWVSGTSEGRQDRSDMFNLALGAPMESFALARIVAVGGSSSNFKVGDLVEVRTTWSDYAIVKQSKAKLRK